LPEALRHLESADEYPVRVSDKLKALAAEVDKRTRR
jgi:hypothetical protein